MIGNSNNCRPKILKNLNKYIDEKVFSGCSDITLQNKNDDMYIFISSKYPKSNEDNKKSSKTSNYITEHMIEENIMDKYDLIKNIDDDLHSIYLNKKENLTLRFHQELITQKNV